MVVTDTKLLFLISIIFMDQVLTHYNFVQAISMPHPNWECWDSND